MTQTSILPLLATVDRRLAARLVPGDRLLEPLESPGERHCLGTEF